MKFTYFFLTTALISLQSHAMLKKISLSRDKNKYTLIDNNEKMLTNSELQRYKNDTELEEAVLLQVIIYENKKCTKKIARRSSSKPKFV